MESQLREFIKYENDIKQFNTKLKEMKLNYKTLYDEILDYMVENDVDCLTCQDSVFEKKDKQVVSAITKDTLKSGFQQFLENNKLKGSFEIIAESGAEYIMNNREKKTKPHLKRRCLKNQS